MESRERVLRCLNHEEPDRVPIDFWASRETWTKLFRRFGVSEMEPILQHFDVDFRYIEGPRYVGKKLAVHPDGSSEDHFGVPRRIVQYGEGERRGTYLELVSSPLSGATSLDEIQRYPKWPSPDDFDYDCVREQARAARETGKIVVFMGDRLNRCAQLKPAMYLRGIEQILIDLLVEPVIARAIFSRIAHFYAEYARRTLEAGQGNIDIFFTGDDFGTQTNLFMAPALWRQLLRDGFKRFIDIGHEYGCKVAHHTCGSIHKILPDITQCGLDILNPLQPEVADMDYRSIKATYGDQICFHGAVSIQRTLPYGTPQDVRAEVKNRAELLSPGGGYIFCTAHNIQADTPIENIEALIAAYSEYGKYS